MRLFFTKFISSSTTIAQKGKAFSGTFLPHNSFRKRDRSPFFPSYMSLLAGELNRQFPSHSQKFYNNPPAITPPDKGTPSSFISPDLASFSKKSEPSPFLNSHFFKPGEKLNDSKAFVDFSELINTRKATFPNITTVFKTDDKNLRIIMPISVGMNHHHEGSDFLACLEAIAREAKKYRERQDQTFAKRLKGLGKMPEISKGQKEAIEELQAAYTNYQKDTQSAANKTYFLIAFDKVCQKYKSDPEYKAEFLNTLESIYKDFSSVLIREVVICVDDELQRWNKAVEQNNPNANSYSKESKHVGDLWVRNNFGMITHTLGGLSPTIVTWDKWLSDLRFPTLYNQVETFYQTNPEFQAAVGTTVEQYVERHMKRKSREVNGDHSQFTSRDLAKELGRKYVLEECTAMWFWAEAVDMEVYPSTKRTPAMDAMVRLFINSQLGEKLRYGGLRIDTVAENKEKIIENKSPNNRPVSTSFKINA